MVPILSNKNSSLGNVLVIGGCGFLGHHIVKILHSSYNCTISVIDLHTSRNRLPESDGVKYFNGDITSIESILPIFLQTKPEIVIHTASPTLTGASRELYRLVNVEGTRCVIEACQKVSVTALIYTSSASIISDNVTDLINADEKWPIIPAKSQSEYYSETKAHFLIVRLTPITAQAEALVLTANRSASHPSLLTCSLRPAGIFGEGDVQLIPNMLKVYENNKTGFQLGDNCNLFDFTYVGNVAQAHCLAAVALKATSSLSTTPLSHEKVDGESFIITNDQPIYFWDFARAVWRAAGSEKSTQHVWEISKDLGMLIGGIMEWTMWCMGKVPSLTRRQVRYSCMTRYFDCSKAKRLLGYRPDVTLREGIERSVRWFEDQKTSKFSKNEKYG
ncbi:Sterol-4-alpha-carboxylate 3-dehydrogenase, decarboxylating [Golovinomyces cichoracearum]|uniref:Sterol-4-alpha-carboxylate 3-dehydrogenase ERG26, decarboxylating n=1 Tax=Golovinomyces cichoracearum TaxID=62708 RepID=A0A420I8R0_9PEZI|nr:Sterol-4-alpha-carboxylate 3-dehydrogenase, decarboxylating [Golovinomyces cichoracearum]